MPEPAGKPARPGTVTMASLLLYALGALALVNAVLSIYAGTLLDKDKIVQIYRDAGMDSATAESAAGFAGVGTYLGGGFYLLLAVAYFVLGAFVGQGKQWARITAWIFGGIAICCGILGAVGNAASSALSGMGGQSGIDQDKMTRDLMELQPSWLAPVSTVLMVLVALAALGVVILLALPPSHPFFRKAEPVWTPPPSFPSA